MTAKHIIWVESEHAFRIIDNDGTAFVANYSRLEDAEHALYLICRQDWQAERDNDLERESLAEAQRETEEGQ